MGREEAKQILLIEKEKWAAKSYVDIDRMEWKEPVHYEVLDGVRTCYIKVLVLQHTKEFIHVLISASDTEMSGFFSLDEDIFYDREKSIDE